MKPDAKGTKSAPTTDERPDRSELLFSADAEKERLALLATVSEVIRTSTDPDDLLCDIATAVGKAFEAQRCLFNEIDLENDEEIVHRDYSNGVPSVEGRHKISLYSSVTSNEMIAGRTVVNSDSKNDPRTADLFHDVYEPAGERAYVAVPLMRDQVWVASLWISCDRPHAWTAADVALLELIAERAWLTVEKLRNEGARRASEAKYQTLFESIDDGFCLAEMIFDDNGQAVDCRILETNAAYDAISPVRAGQTVKEVFPDTDNEVLKIYADVVATGEPERIERYNPFLDKWINSRISRVGGEGSRQIAVVFSDVTARRRTEEELKRTETLFSSFMRHLPGLAWIKDGDGRYVFVNDAAEAAFSKPRDGIMGKADDELFPAETADAFRHNDARVRETRLGMQTLETLEQQDGELHHSLVSKFPIFEPEDDPTMIGGIAIDVTEQRKAEMALRAREAELKLIADMTPIVLVRCSKDLKYQFINRAGAALFDLEPEQVVGRSVPELMGPEAFSMIQPYVERALAGEYVEYDMEVPYPTGTHWMRVSYSPDTDASGEVLGWLASIVDETELRKLMRERAETERSLIRSQQRFQLAQEAGRVGIWDWNIIDSKTYWSETTWDFYGESPGIAEPNSEFWTSHIHPEDREKVTTRLAESLDSDVDHYRDEFRIVRGDGSILWIESNATIARDDSGKAVRLYGVNIDMTERRKSAEELQRAHDELELRVAERTRELAETNDALLREADARIAGEEQRIFLLRRLVSGQEIERRRIARDIHDQLGQRVTALRLKLESLRQFVGNDDEIAGRVGRLQEIGEKLDSEVSFLAWELRPSVLDDLGLVDALRAFVKEWSRHFEVNADFQPLGVGQDRFDSEIETHLYRIAQEALNNVSKYAQATNVTVVLERREHELLLIIEDDGVGFDVNAQRAPAEAGRGLGLIGMNERASLIGGNLEIESSSAGTTVYARIPVFTV